MASIHIRNLKNISELDFEIPVGGVHILTGVNGCGKTSLLVCLERLAYSHAFSKHFKTSPSQRVDNYRSSSIAYSHNSRHVTYLYRNTRWAPNPRLGASVLRSMGFVDVIYLTSASERFYIQNEELYGKVTGAPQFFKDAMREIFQVDRFDELRRIKLTGRGRGYGRYNYGFLMPLPNVGSQTRYYSEKNFSLGEIIILNALDRLQAVRDNSLVLIDEVELALHPKVQINFLKFLEEMADRKNLTIIISTHSSSLIKASTNLIYLEQNALGVVNVNYKCYPAVVLKDLAFSEDFFPDIVLCVEDDQAEMLLSSMIRFYFGTTPTNRARPEFKILPIAGWPQVLSFREKSNGFLFPNGVKIHSVLDQDSETSIQDVNRKAAKTEAERELIRVFNASRRFIHFLPVTPELGLFTLFTSNPAQFDRVFQDAFETANLNISRIIAEENRRFGTTRSNRPRDAAKTWFIYITTELNRITNWDKFRIQRKMYDIYVSNVYVPASLGQLRGLLGPIFS